MNYLAATPAAIKGETSIAEHGRVPVFYESNDQVSKSNLEVFFCDLMVSTLFQTISCRYRVIFPVTFSNGSFAGVESLRGDGDFRCSHDEGW